MKSKAVMFVCLLFLSVVVMASDVSEANHDQAVEVGSDDLNPEESKQGVGVRCRRGCCFRRGRVCVRCCPSTEEEASTVDEAQTTPNFELDDVNPEESKQGVGRCRRGCCLRRGRVCVRCCPFKADEAQTIPDVVSDDTNPEESKQIARC